MNELRNKIAALKYGERITSPPSVFAFNEAIDDVLALPELKSIIEKAEKYDNLFSSLQTVKTHKALCVSRILTQAKAEQDIYRPLTETEKEEVMKWMFNFIFVRRSNQSFPLIAFTLNSGIRVVVKK